MNLHTLLTIIIVKALIKAPRGAEAGEGCESADDFRCRAGGSCISSRQVCDGVGDCPDASDEIHDKSCYVQDVTVVKVYPEDDPVDGSKLDLRCSFTAYPPLHPYRGQYTVDWYFHKDGKLNHIGTGYELSINTVTTSNTGGYSCSVIRIDKSWVESPQRMVTVQRANPNDWPRLRIQPSEVAINQSVLFTCTPGPSGRPAPTRAVVYFGDQVLRLGSTLAGSHAFSSLTDSGLPCTCTVSVGDGWTSPRSQPERLLVRAPAYMESPRTPLTVTPVLGDPARPLRLVCTASGHNRTLAWTKNGDDLLADDRFSMEETLMYGKFSYGQNEALQQTITWEPAAAASCDQVTAYSGQYGCTARVVIGGRLSTDILDDAYTVDVKYGPIAVKTSGDVYESAEEESVELACEVCANPEPTNYTWTRKGEREGPVLARNHTLHIARVRAADFGNYTCRACNHVACAAVDVQLQPRSAWTHDATIAVSVIAALIVCGLIVAVLIRLIYRRNPNCGYPNCGPADDRTSPTNEDTSSPLQGHRGETEKAAGDYLYDVFVSYSNVEADRTWVHFTLVPELETNHGLTACIHHRDFVGGEDIMDNIEMAIRRSRKVLAIMSPDFLLSNWCTREMQMADTLDQDHNTNKVLFVMLRDVSRAVMPAHIRFLLDNRTYIRVDQCRFWHRLINAIRN